MFKVKQKTMKNILRKLFYLFILSAITWSCNDDDELYPQLGNDPKNITEILSETSDFSTLYGALSQVGLDETLGTTTTYTVFAPNNSAFANTDVSGLSQEELENALLNHVLMTTTADFTASMTTGYLTTMAIGPDDNNLSFYTNTTGELRFNGMASLVDGGYDKGATNGIVHTIDAVLTPPTVVDHIAANPDYSSLASAVQKAGLVDALNEAGAFTVFAPNNAAFEMFMAQVNGAFGWATLDDIPVDVLQQVLLYHVISEDNILDDDFDGSTQTSMQGSSFILNESSIVDASYTDTNIILTNVQSVNGIVHGIDKVILNDEVFQSILSATLNIAERCEDRGFTTFLEAVEKAGLTNTISTEELTAFVPNNDGFIALFADAGNFESLDDFDTPEEITLLADLLNYHLYSGTLMLSDLSDGQEVTSVYGEIFTVDLGGDFPRFRPTFEDAIPSGLVTGNIGATNGMIHEINRVMVPDSLIDALGIDRGGCDGAHPVGDPSLVFFDWDANGPWWGNVNAENDPAISLDGSSYGRANFTTSGGGWNDMYWRNGSTMNGQNVVADNLDDYVLKFDVRTIDPISAGTFKFRFHDNDGVDAFYDWAPWTDSGEALDTDGGWVTFEIPLSVIGQPDYSMVDNEFGMAFDDGGVALMLNFAIDNVRFDAPGYTCGGPDPVDDPSLVFFDWDANGPWWGNVNAENDPAISLDGSSYGRANFTSSAGGWNDMYWRNSSTMNGQNIVADNINDYVLKFDISTIEPISAGIFKFRFHSDAVDAFYDFAPWTDSGEPLDTEGGWITLSIPLSVIGQPNYSEVNQEFGMAFEDGGVPIILNFAIDNVRFEAL